MRLLLCLVGAASLAASGWIGWRATAESREWREFVRLGAKAKRNEAEWGRFVLLGHRLFPDQGASSVRVMTVLDGPAERRRILAIFVSRGGSGREARLQVLDEDGRRLSSCMVPMGGCGIDCRPAPERGPWAFDIEALTPGAPVSWRYALVDERPVLVSPADKE
ncbi:MAG TPA: hypothetical protein VNM14_25940 [Planctomycetota bacterium]|jgi:hypothetical protein|nr:hypothetical protein [Planctomycetota bacterium]